MNISENLQRILTDKQNIANAINAKGVSCQFSESLDTYADKISRISGGGGETGPEPVFSDSDPLTFVAIDDNCSLTLANNGQAITSAIFTYSLDGNTWNSYTQGTEIELKKYQFIQFKNSNANFNNEQDGRGYAYQFYTNGDFKCYGNVMSLINNSSIMNPYSFQYLFYGTNILTAPALPATKIAMNCYQYMFANCTKLTKAPTLPATTLASHCYQNMFYGCTSLTTAPTLPATKLAPNCYQNMFSFCLKLKNAPALKANTLENYCYQNMFESCTSLTTAPTLPATTLASSCYNGMFYGCSSLTTAPKLPATTLQTRCYSSMFQRCYSLTTAPTLPATTLVRYCYQNMFYDCRKLNYIKAMFTTEPSSSFTSYWVKGVSSKGTFVKNSAATWTTTGVHAIPTGWTVQTASS